MLQLRHEHGFAPSPEETRRSNNVRAGTGCVHEAAHSQSDGKTHLVIRNVSRKRRHLRQTLE